MRRTEFLASLGEVYRPFIVFTAVALLTLQASRILLVFLLWDRVNAVDGLWILVAQGLRFDFLLICAFIALPLSVHAFLFNGKAWRTLLTTYLLIAYGVIEPKKIDRQASQIDLIPTVLGLMGIHSPTPAIGIDLLRPDIDTIPGRAVMQYDKTQAYMQGDHVVIMKLDRDPALYIRTQSGLTQSPEQNSDLVKRAVGIATWTTYTYQNRGYGLPENHGG